MIIGSADKGDTMKFSGKILTVLYVSREETTVKCTMKDEVLNCMHTKVFRRVGGDIKSGIDLGNCQKYIPAKRKFPEVGKKITLPCGTLLTIRGVLKRTRDGWRCFVSYDNAFSCFLKTIRISDLS